MGEKQEKLGSAYRQEQPSLVWHLDIAGGAEI